MATHVFAAALVTGPRILGELGLVVRSMPKHDLDWASCDVEARTLEAKHRQMFTVVWLHEKLTHRMLHPRWTSMMWTSGRPAHWAAMTSWLLHRHTSTRCEPGGRSKQSHGRPPAAGAHRVQRAGCPQRCLSHLQVAWATKTWPWPRHGRP